jgi:hypothetical protein
MRRRGMGQLRHIRQSPVAHGPGGGLNDVLEIHLSLPGSRRTDYHGHGKSVPHSYRRIGKASCPPWL